MNEQKISVGKGLVPMDASEREIVTNSAWRGKTTEGVDGTGTFDQEDNECGQGNERGSDKIVGDNTEGKEPSRDNEGRRVGAHYERKLKNSLVRDIRGALLAVYHLAKCYSKKVGTTLILILLM